MQSLYKNLPEPNRTNLVNLCERIKKETSILSYTFTPTEKSRKTIINKIIFSLLYGLEEIKIHKDEESFWSNPLIANSPKFSQIKNLVFLPEEPEAQKTQIETCKDLATEIEIVVFVLNKENVTSEYKDKLYNLCTFMTHSKNQQLREKILFGVIPPEKLITMSSDELSPPDELQKLQEQKRKYFKENMLLTDDNNVIAINHKEVTSNTLMEKNDYGEKNNYYEVTNLPKQEDNEKNNKNKKEDKNKKNKAIETKSDLNALIQESKYNGLSSENLNFYFELEENNLKSLSKKINDKINNLKKSTVEEINKKREELGVKLIV